MGKHVTKSFGRQSTICDCNCPKLMWLLHSVSLLFLPYSINNMQFSRVIFEMPS